MTSAPEKTAAEKEELVTVTIDGLPISVPKGTLLIRAAELLGISIPRFCDHPLLDPAGACRQCLVEVPDMGNGRGMPKPAASCTTTVMPGMVIKTQLTSAVADKAQQGVMELLLINHPLDCPVCDKGGECPLQNQAMSNGRADSRFHEKKRTFPKPLAISSNVLLDRERCVLCQRCTRFSMQIAGDPFIELLERGADQQIGTSEEVPFQSYFSGNTVQICPVGALTNASYRFRARPFDLQSTDSICEHCSSGCAQRTDWRRSKVTRRLAGNDPEVNEEWNCDKGRWAFHNAEQADRVVTPLVRNDDGVLVEASWPEALERAATGLCEAVDRGGVGVLPGGRLTEEDAYAYAKFARVALGTNDIDARSRAGSAEELDFLAAHAAGVTPQHVSYRSLEKAPAVLLAGFEPEEESPIVFLRLRKATRNGRTKVWSLAPFASGGLTKLNGTLLATVPGDEAAGLRDLPAEITDGPACRRCGDPRRRAARAVRRRPGCRCRTGWRHRGSAGLGAPARGRARRDRRRSVAEPAARRAHRGRRRAPHRGRGRLGRAGADRRGRRRRRHLAGRRRRRAGRARGRRRRPGRLRRPGARRAGAGQRRLRRQPGGAAQRRHRARRRGAAGRAGHREGRPLRQLGRPPPPVRARHPRHRRHVRRPGAERPGRGDGRRAEPADRRGRARRAAAPGAACRTPGPGCVVEHRIAGRGPDATANWARARPCSPPGAS